MSHLKVDGWLANDGGYPGSEPPMLIQIENANLQGKALIQVHIKVFSPHKLTVIFRSYRLWREHMAHQYSLPTQSKRRAWPILHGELVKWSQPLSTPSELFTWSGIRPECEINGNSSLLARLGLALGDWELGQQAGHGVAVRDESEESELCTPEAQWSWF